MVRYTCPQKSPERNKMIGQRNEDPCLDPKKANSNLKLAPEMGLNEECLNALDRNQFKKCDQAIETQFQCTSSVLTSYAEVEIVFNKCSKYFRLRTDVGGEILYKEQQYGFEETDQGKLGVLFYIDSSGIMALAKCLGMISVVRKMGQVFWGIWQKITADQSVKPKEIEGSSGIINYSALDTISQQNVQIPQGSKHMTDIYVIYTETEMSPKQPGKRADLTVSRERNNRKQIVISQKLEAGSEDVPKNYSESEHSLDMVKNLCYCLSEEREKDQSKKNLFDSSEYLDSNMTRQLESEERTEMLMMYHDHRHIVLLASGTKAERNPEILEMLHMMYDSRSGQLSVKSQLSKKGSERDLIIDHKGEFFVSIDRFSDLDSTKLKLKLHEQIEEKFDDDDIDKNIPRISVVKGKNSEDHFLPEERHDERDQPDQLSREWFREIKGLRLRVLSLPSSQRSTRDPGGSERDLYSSSNEESTGDSTDSNEDSEEDSADMCSTCSSSQQLDVDESEGNLTSTEDEELTDLKEQISDEEKSDDVPYDQRSSQRDESFPPTAVLHSAQIHETDSAGRTERSDLPVAENLCTRVQVDSKKYLECGSRREDVTSSSRNAPEQTGSTLLKDDLDTDGAAACESVQLSDPSIPEQPSSVHLGERPPSTETNETSFFSTPVQVSSPTNSEHCTPEYPEYFIIQPSEDSFIATSYDKDNETICSGISVPANLQPDSEDSSLGACGGHSPVAAAEEQRHYSGIPPEDCSGPYVTEETMCPFRSEQDARPQPRSPGQAPAQHGFWAQETSCASNTDQPEPTLQSSPAPVHHQPIIIHTAGSLPPSATQVARIDLSLSVNREFAPLRQRRATYDDDWPYDNSGIDAANMALAGFFQTGPGRRVRCFYCGLELDHFAAGDNVWDEHVRYRPTCPYLLAIMGEDMVLQTQINLSKKP